MINWIWIPVFFLCGMVIGLLYGALCNMASRSDAEADTMLDREGR